MSKLIIALTLTFIGMITTFILGMLVESELDAVKYHEKPPIIKNARFHCRDCHNQISIKDKYCNQCGRKIDWR